MQLSCLISRRVIRITGIDLADLLPSHKCICTCAFLQPFIPSFYKIWHCIHSDKVKLYSAAAVPTRATIRPCNIKAHCFQRLSFTANFRSPGSYMSRQHTKGCFHHHLPIQHPKSSPTAAGSQLSGARLDKPCLDFCKKQGISRQKVCHPTLVLDLVSLGAWLEAIWSCSLKNAPLSFLIACSWSILASWHWTRCGWTLMEWTWILLSIVGGSYMWRTVVCFF